MRGGTTKSLFLIRSVQVDVARKRIHTAPAIHAGLKPAQTKDAGEDEVALPARAPFRSRKNFAGEAARDEN